jgi:hypothetical protein
MIVGIEMKKLFNWYAFHLKRAFVGNYEYTLKEILLHAWSFLLVVVPYLIFFIALEVFALWMISLT